MARVVIVGGVAAGMSAAARLRRLDESSEIIVLERGEYISYANCGLPYYIGKEIEQRDALLLQTPQSFRQRFNVDVRTRHEAIALYPGSKELAVVNHAAGEEYRIEYDTLLLAPGGSPIRPPIPGIEHPAIRTLWTIPDTDDIRLSVDNGTVQQALVVGAGFIGLEMAENLRLRGIDVTLVEMAPQVMTVIDREMAGLIHRELRRNGVTLYLNERVTGFTPLPGGRVQAEFGSGKQCQADLVLLSIGVKPNTAFLSGSGIRLGGRGHIIVDKELRTSLPDVFAAGDAIEVFNPLTGKQYAAPLAGPANKQGRIAADNINGKTIRSYNGTIGTAIAKVFGLAVGITGLSESFCRTENVLHQSVTIHGLHHAGYYPGSALLTVKLVFSPETGTILGAQCAGAEGVDKRLDVIATAIKAGMTVDDLTEIEHSYAPPYSSAKDPVNMIGFVAQNVLQGLVKSVTVDQLHQLVDAGGYLLDVRTAGEFSMGSIPGAVNIPVDSLRNQCERLPKDKTMVLFCKVGLRGYLASRMLSAAGFGNVVNLSGGYETWRAAQE